jgi:hypothetical protein
MCAGIARRSTTTPTTSWSGPSAALYELSKTPWGGDLYGLTFDGLDGLARFVVDHYACGSFLVVSEYYQKGDERREKEYPPTPAYPDSPVYGVVCLERAVERAKEAAANLEGKIRLAMVWPRSS